MKNLKKLSKKNLKEIHGGGYGENDWGACRINGVWVSTKCLDRCPNGTDPICLAPEV